MKNWDKANVRAFDHGEGITGCFIEDIEKGVEEGEVFIFQKCALGIELIATTKDKLTDSCIAINDDYDDNYKREYDGCYWNDGLRINEGQLHYFWEVENKEGPFLIWWDHDLGDVVIDSIDNDEVLEGDLEVIKDKVYFYWIT